MECESIGALILSVDGDICGTAVVAESPSIALYGLPVVPILRF